MPAAFRVGDVTSDNAVGASGSPNVFINDINSFVPAVNIPDATTSHIQAIVDDYVAHPTNYTVQNVPVGDDQTKKYNMASPDIPAGKGGEADPTKNEPTPSETGNKFSFVGGNQSVKNVNNPTGGSVTNSWPAGWTQAKGGIVAVIRPKSSASVLPVLQRCLGEGSAWNETGMGGGPSNPKIVGIWKDLGVGTSGPWANDQTAWCAGFVNWALKQAGLAWTPQAGAKATAASTDKLQATRVDIKDMQPGDIVLWSYSHVNFCYKRFD